MRVGPNVIPNKPIFAFAGRLMVKPEMIWPSPSKLPEKGLPVAPIGTNPTPEFQVEVAVASMLLPYA